MKVMEKRERKELGRGGGGGGGSSTPSSHPFLSQWMHTFRLGEGGGQGV